jgi:Cu(I)/Ag(I) efflux system protein CusF
MGVTLKKKAAATVILILSLSLTLSCKHSQSQQSVVGAVHHGVGVVESIDKEMATVQINHEDIKDYMPAMSMPYPVKDRSLLDSVSPGDRVEFSLEGTSKGDVVSEIKRIETDKKP